MTAIHIPSPSGSTYRAEVDKSTGFKLTQQVGNNVLVIEMDMLTFMMFSLALTSIVEKELG